MYIDIHYGRWGINDREPCPPSMPKSLRLPILQREKHVESWNVKVTEELMVAVRNF